jgi:hypothetical protein
VPFIKSRYDNVKVYRPNGTPYSEGKAKLASFTNLTEIAHAVELASGRSVKTFIEEHGDPGFLHRRIVVEVVVDSIYVRAVCYNLPD